MPKKPQRHYIKLMIKRQFHFNQECMQPSAEFEKNRTVSGGKNSNINLTVLYKNATCDVITQPYVDINSSNTVNRKRLSFLQNGHETEISVSHVTCWPNVQWQESFCETFSEKERGNHSEFPLEYFLVLWIYHNLYLLFL